ncbi:hypothetical protein TNCT_54831 [Trichonephila clavata]|uniref:Uncharacterized protein n=1 Tax=Trichonephila clavata TaxID=2740835 RepID=A0A8X6F6M3_TRICU|nr:hypothetical protein TNCT_54831 [Trichonephila clavata]
MEKQNTSLESDKTSDNIENYCSSVDKIMASNKDMCKTISPDFSPTLESIKTNPPPSPDNQIQEFNHNRNEAQISPPTMKKPKISPNISPIHGSEDKDSLTFSGNPNLLSALQKENFLKAWDEHVLNTPQLLNTELLSLDDDTYMEEDRYLGDKGKRPMNPKYAYKKKSKSVLDSKLVCETDIQTFASKAFQIHSQSNAQEERSQSADKDETSLSTKFECEKQLPHI